MAKYISFANRKGGVGKSTLLTLTATALGQFRKNRRKVLVIDADLQASIYEQRQIDREDIPEGGLVESLVIPFDVVRFSFAKTSDADVPVLRFTRLIQDADKKYDVVFIDAPGTMEGEVIPTILTVSDAVVIPVIGSILDINSTISFLSLVEDVNAQRDNDLQVVGVVNKKDRTSEYGELAGLEGVAGLHLLKSTISNRVQYRRLSTVERVVKKDKDHEFNDYMKEITKVLKL